MRNLLSANFLRLRKSFVFWLGIAYQFVVGLIAVGTRWREMHEMSGYFPHADNILFSGALFMPIVAAVFIGLFIGTEYSDGTIRNKIVVGQSRWAIYLANLITCSVALVLMHLAFLLAVVAVGFPLVGNLEKTPQELLLLAALSLMTVLALGALFLLLVMLVTKKSIAAVAVLLLGFVLMMSAMVIDNKLDEPKFYTTVSSRSTDEEGNIQVQESGKERNTNYLEGTKRKVYVFLNDFLPGSQFLQFSKQELTSPVRLPLYSLVILLGTTACGVVCFGRKDLK